MMSRCFARSVEAVIFTPVSLVSNSVVAAADHSTAGASSSRISICTLPLVSLMIPFSSSISVNVISINSLVSDIKSTVEETVNDALLSPAGIVSVRWFSAGTEKSFSNSSLPVMV